MSKKDLEFKIDGKHHPTKKGNISNLKVQGNDATFNAILDKQIRNEKDLMDAAGVDQKEWMVNTWECTMWEQGAKYRDQDLKWFGVEGSAQVMEGYSIRKNEWIKQQLWRVKASFKRNIAYMQMNDFKSELMDEIKKVSKPVSKFKFKKYEKACLFVIDLPDLHFDKLAWGKETGKDWDMKISSSLYMKAIDDLVSKASVYNVEKILYPVGNDMFNSDTIDNTTTKGTKQIVDGRWKKSFVLARKLIVSAVLKLSQIAPVQVMIVPGNHDEQKTFYLGDALECRFYNDANVNVDNTPMMRKYFKYGKTLIAYTHGKDEKIDRLPMILATEAKDLFSQTDFHEWHIGDKHHKKDVKFTPAEEVDGVIVRQLSSLTALDEWHYRKGYLAKQAGQGFIYDKSLGWVCQFNSFYN